MAYAIVRSNKTGRAVVLDLDRQRYLGMVRKVKAFADAMSEFSKLSEIKFSYIMVTLTYVQIDDWVANDLKDYVRNVARRKTTFGYCWVAELQYRGAVHYHILFAVKYGNKIEFPDRSGSWVKGMSNVRRARSVYYVLTYVGKKYQKDYSRMPKGLRSYAVGTYDKLLRRLYRYNCLSEHERAYVDQFGFDGLKQWVEDTVFPSEYSFFVQFLS